MRQCDGSLRGALRGVLSAIAMATAIARSKRSGSVRATLLLVDSFTPGLQAPVYTRLSPLPLGVVFSPSSHLAGFNCNACHQPKVDNPYSVTFRVGRHLYFEWYVVWWGSMNK